MNELRIVVVAICILLFSVLQLAINAKKARRVRQFPLIIVSLLLMITGIILWLNNLDAAAEICKEAFLNNGEIVLVNLSLLLAFAVLRLVLLPISTAVCKKKALLENFSFGFYEYDEEYDEWFLRKQWVNFRKYFLAILVGLYLATSIFLICTWLEGPSSALWLYIFPCAAIVVIIEIYNFVNGQTKSEFDHSVLGDESDSRRVSNYYKLREILEQILPEPLLSAHTGCEFIGTQSAADLLKEMADSGNKAEQVIADYFQAEGRYKVANVDCVQATAQMMKRRNVVFFNPFYRDLGMYVTLPLVTAMLSGKKCIVLCGRKSVAEDVKAWVSALLQEYSHMQSMWRVNLLSDKEPECEVGIITFTQLYDKRVINTNRDFLNDTDFVLMIEPSIMLNTSQVALSILAEEMQCNDEKPVYCICDRSTDGLIDTMSHLLHAEITDVVAMPVPRCTYTAMSWNADGDFSRQRLFDKQTKYLGNGIELAAVAVKNQIPKVSWYGETKVPVKDIKWIAGQYYSTICRYMNLPSQQKKLYEKIDFLPNLWSAKETKEEFIIAEDEFCNMFSMMRAYLSRGKTQTFVNVLSENYLLRDYMRCNRQLFMSNPNAIPSYVPDYAKTERNTILKLILMMALRPVSEDEVLKEFHLVGIATDDAFGTLCKLLHKYTFADSTIFTVQSVRMAVDEFTTISSCNYSITDEEFDKFFSDSLKNAYYILEDEKNEEGYIDARLFSHVTQTIIAGQFVTYGGKYYIAKHVSPQSGVVLRRASNLFDGRKYYRQVRKYTLDTDAKQVISARKIGDIEFAEIQIDYHVDTSGYLEMDDNHNLRTARLIDMSMDPTVGNYSRKYRNKSVLKIKLPEADEKIRFTICMLLSEAFKSIFPDGWPYLAVVAKQPDDIDGMLNYMMYAVDGTMDEECIYIIEDSDIDLGLLNAVEKHFMKLMEIVADFLEWHFEKMREPASKDPIPVKVSLAEAEEKKKRGLIVRMLDRIRKLFGGKKEKVEVPTVESAEEAAGEPAPAPQPEAVPTDTSDGGYQLDSEESMSAEEPQVDVASEVDGEAYSLDEKSESTESVTETDAVAEPALDFPETVSHPEDEFLPSEDADPDLVAIDGTDIFDNSGMPEDNEYLENSFAAMGLTPITKSRYQRECFLKFGFEEIDSRIKVDEVRKYLRVRGWANNALTLARKRDILVRNQLDTSAVNHCDFCGLPLSGISYDRLNDGRIRCNDCSNSAISSIADFKELFYQSLNLMESFFDIRYRVPISVKMADARTVAKGAGIIFRPSTQVASRVLGFAQRKRGQYSLLVENGSPRLAAIDTMVHEMTHIWQYLNWNDSLVMRIYGMSHRECSSVARDIVYEGMAMWASIQYLYQIGESYYAAQQEALAASRNDVYGIGFRLYQEQYPLVKDSSLLKHSPFQSFPTIEPDAVRNAVRSRCTNPKCDC